MNVYVAAMYSRKLEARAVAEKLRGIGCTIVSTWLEEPYAPSIKLHELTDQDLRELAMTDIQDISNADLLVFLAESPEALTPRGGRHVEFGYALGTGIPIVTISEYAPENIFGYLPETQVAQVEDTDALLTWVSSRMAKTGSSLR